MDLLATVLLGLIIAVVAVFVLVLFFRISFSEVVYLGATMLPMVWLSRLHLQYITIAESTFVLLWAVLALLCLVGLVLGNKHAGIALKQVSRPVVLSFAALLVLMIVSNLVNSRGVADFVRGVSAILFVILPFLTARSVVRLCRADRAGVQRAVVALLLAGNLLAGISLISAFAPSLTKSLGVGVTYQTYSYARAYSPLGGANGTGMVLIMVYCLGFGEIFAQRHRILGTITVLTAFLALLATLARGALIGFVVANVFLFLWQPRRLGRHLVIALAFGSFLLIPLAYQMNKVFTLERLNISGAGVMTGSSTSARLSTMRASFDYGIRHPVLGGGWGLVYENPRLRYAYQPGSAGRTIWLDGTLSLATPHSLPALVFVESGSLAPVALAVFAWLMWRSLRLPPSATCPEDTGLVHGFRAGVLGFLCVSLAQDNLFLSDGIAFYFYLFLFTGLMTTYVFAAPPTQNSPQRAST